MEMTKKVLLLFPQLMALICLVTFSLSSAEVSLTVGDGTGLPGSKGRTVEVSLDNSGETEAATGMTMYVCDEDNYLSVTGCQTMGRTVGTCSSWNIDDCAYVTLSGSIPQGSGSIYKLTYSVSYAATGECKDLTPEYVVITPYGDVTSYTGEFCFKCASDGECADSLYCNGEEYCDEDGFCQHDPACPSDDGLYCNGKDICDEMLNQCRHEYNSPDTICSPQLCNELSNSCYCTENGQCDDGLYCTGVETCNTQTGVCNQGSNPCTSPYACDEEGNQCLLSQVRLEVTSTGAYPGTQNHLVPVKLYNPTQNGVKAVEMDVCDAGDYLTCTGCDRSGLITDGGYFDCNAVELTNGCCHVAIVSVYMAIPTGYRTILKIRYDISAGITGCKNLTPENIEVINDMNPPQELVALPVSGVFCVPCYGDFECDGDVDGTNAIQLKGDFGRRNCNIVPKCMGDFDCDRDVDGTDAVKFKKDFGRKNCLPPCSPGNTCWYGS